MKVLSLGAGVQSSTLLLMSCVGEYEKPDVAIFADTQSEPEQVYRWLEFIETEANKYGVKVVRVTKGSLRNEALKRASGEASRWSSVPFFVKNEDGTQGRLMRHCMQDFKIAPVQQAIRQYLGLAPGQRVKEPVEMWMGISTDEWMRMKPSRVKWIVNKYPLIEMGMSRNDCLQWMKSHGYPLPPKSSCTFCPYHSNEMWRLIKENNPDEWREVVEFDRRIRHMAGVRGEVYLHRSMKPIDEVNLGEDQMELDLFGEECEGMCGV